MLASESNDEGRSEYVYARDGRIRFSQSALQRPAGRFSYSNYDGLGRVVESGEYTPANAQDIQFQNQLPQKSLTETTSEGAAGFVNVPPGLANVSATLGGRALTGTSAISRGGWVTYVELFP